MAPRFGIDIDAVHLTIAQSGSSETVVVANSAEAIAAWLTQLPTGSSVAVESSGRCHETLLTLALAHQVPLYLLNPLDVRRYAQGVGRRAKTDRVDAHVIARLLDREIADLRPYSPPPAAFAQIRSLLRHRASVVAHRAALQASLHQTPWLSELQTAFATTLKAIDAQLDALLHSVASVCRLRQRLLTIPGVGPMVSALLVSLLVPHAFASSDALVAFVGLDPRASDSGQRSGRRKLTKRGDAEARRLLYLAAKAFARTVLGQPLYRRYRDRALSATATYVILARKLLRIAWAMHQRDREFDPQCLAGA